MCSLRDSSPILSWSLSVIQLRKGHSSSWKSLLSQTLINNHSKVNNSPRWVWMQSLPWSLSALSGVNVCLCVSSKEDLENNLASNVSAQQQELWVVSSPLDPWRNNKPTALTNQHNDRCVSKHQQWGYSPAIREGSRAQLKQQFLGGVVRRKHKDLQKEGH